MKSIRTNNSLSAQNAPVLGARVVYDIPRTADLEAINITYSGNIQLTTGATALITDGVANLIESVELTANGGRDVICSVPFALLVQGNWARRKAGKVPTLTQPGVTIATHPYEANAVIDLASFGGVRPKDTSLRENNYESLQLALRFGSDYTKVFTGGGFVIGAATTHNLSVSAQECIEVKDASGNYTSPSGRVLKTATDLTLSAATVNYQHKLTPNQGLRALVLKVTTNATPPVLSDALISRLRVKVGQSQRLSLSAAEIKADMKLNAATANLPGYYVLDFADGNGSPDRLLDALNLYTEETNGADALLEIDTTAGAIISVMQDGAVNV